MNNGTRLAWPLRAWFGVELFFAVSALLSVAVAPGQTQTNFAWTIKPEVMAALFGAFYAALAPVGVLLLLARRWENVRVFVLPAAGFTAAQLGVTLLHWDRFAVGTGPFNLWFASYLLPPPVFLACHVWQQRRAAAVTPGRNAVDAAPLARWQRRALLALGALVTLEAIVGLVWPVWFTASAPWRVTPLNARALAGFLMLLGLLMLSMARENDRDRVRIVSPFLVLLLPLVVIQVSRFAEQVDWRHPRIAATLALLAAVGVIGLSLARGSWSRTLR